MSKENEQIIQIDFAEEMKNSYRDYAMSVIISRALPDIRDGLKPVQRRILYSMIELGLDPNKPHRKSARIVGDTMGKYHPHGDTSIYDALVRMSEEYSLPVPLVDGHGNFGSIDGDGAAAMRYTEARLSKGAMALIDHLEKGLIEFRPNFDDSEKEPVVLPAMIPNLLINGTTGIAVGMATNIPPHNPVEVIDGVIAYMDRPNITIEGLMKYIPGPDFPTGGTIINSDEILKIYESGEGRLRLRAKTEIEKGDNGRKNIIITEIPYTVAGNKTKLVESLSTLMKDKVFDEIFDIRDESSKEGIRVVIEVKKDRDIENLLNGLYKRTNLEDTYSVNLLAIKEQQPIIFNLKEMIVEFVDFQEELYTKEYNYMLQKAENRLEIVEGLIKATDIIDLIIEILRGSSSIKQAKECLILGKTEGINFKSKASSKVASKLNFTERQADAILTMQLSKLIGLEVLKLHDEEGDLLKSIDEYRSVLGSKEELYKIIKSRLRAYKKLFNFERKTIIDKIVAVDYKEEIKIEDIYVLIDKFGYTKTVDTASVTRASDESLKEFSAIIQMKNLDKLCVFTDKGNLYQIKAEDIPRARIRDKGTLIHSLCNFNKESIVLYTSFETLFESQLLIVTKNGFIKQVSGVEYETNRSVLMATKLDEDDKVISLSLLSGEDVVKDNQKIIIITNKGLSLGFQISDVPEQKRGSRGAKAITIDEDDYVVFMTNVNLDAETFTFNDKILNAKRVRNRKRGAKGQNAQLEIED